jgi:hypothetical protein
MMPLVGTKCDRDHDKLGVAVGYALIVSGLVLNEWVIASIASSDGRIELSSVRATIWTIDALLVLLGAFILKYPQYGRGVLLCVTPFVSLAACSLVIFALLELFPSLIVYMPFGYADYYEQRVRYVPDDELIYKYKPLSSFQTGSFKGELYQDSYGVDVTPMPYSAVFDEYGFRNGPMPTGGWEVVVLGDSFIEFGHDEDDTFSSRLEALSGMKTRNLGIGGHGPFQYLATLKRYALTPTPRYVLFGFFEGNDIGDIRLYLRWKDTNEYPYSNLRGKNVAQRYVMALRDVLLNPLVRALEGAKGSPDNLVALRIGEETIQTIFRYKLETQTPGELLELNEWNVLRELFGQFKAIAAEHHFVPIVLFFPTKAHIYAEYSTSDSGAKWLAIRDKQIAAKDNVETAVRTLCREVGIELISLSPAFEQAASRGKLVYYPFDSHWNSEGRQVAASVVAARLGAGHATN